MDTPKDRDPPSAPQSEAKPPRPMQLARAAIERDDWSAAIPHLKAAAAHQPENPQILMKLGRALGEAGCAQEADAAIQRALELDPTNVKARLAAGRSAWKQGRRSEAVAGLEAAAAAAPGNSKLDLALGGKLLELLRLEDATSAFRRVIAAEPRNAAALKGLAQCAVYMGDNDEALTALRAANAIEPGDARIEDQIRQLEGGIGEYDWKAEVRDAIDTLNAGDGGRRMWAAQILLAYGMTDLVQKALTPLESTSAPARRVLQMARQLDRLGLTHPSKAPADGGDPETQQLNGLKGFTERLTPGADTLVLVFAGAANRAFLSLDLMHRILRTTGASLAYFRDVNRTLFLRGIVGLSEDFVGTAEAFRDMMARSGARRLMLIGHCGGASAALRFGLALNAEAVLAIAPRILGVAFFENRPGQSAAKLEEARQSLGRFAGDLPVIYREAERTPRVTLLAGAGMEPEASFSRDMAAKVPGVAYVEIPGGRKDCLGVVLERGLLSPLFSSFVTHGAVAPEILENLRRPAPDRRPSLEGGPSAVESASSLPA